MIYLDNAATSFKKPRCVLRALKRYQKNLSVNAGRGGHSLSLAGLEHIIDAAESLAKLFNIPDPARIAFFPNATYALNAAIGGLCGREDHAVVTQMEHNSVLRPVHLHTSYTVAEADSEGYVIPAAVQAAIRPDTKLIICTHASNVTGSIQPIEEIAAIAHAYGLPLLIDCAQTAGAFPIDVREMGADMIAFSGHKGLLGPLGTGGLYAREGLSFKPVIAGGTGSHSESLEQPNDMPDIFHCGTLNTPAIAALGKSARYILERGVDRIAEEERELAVSFINALLEMENVTVYGSPGDRPHNGTVSFNIDALDPGETARILNDRYKIAVRAGYHCAPLAHRAIGSENKGTVRVSFGAFSSVRELRRICDAVYALSRKGV